MSTLLHAHILMGLIVTFIHAYADCVGLTGTMQMIPMIYIHYTILVLPCLPSKYTYIHSVMIRIVAIYLCSKRYLEDSLKCAGFPCQVVTCSNCITVAFNIHTRGAYALYIEPHVLVI
jgi:hypothetical protein